MAANDTKRYVVRSRITENTTVGSHDSVEPSPSDRSRNLLVAARKPVYRNITTRVNRSRVSTATGVPSVMGEVVEIAFLRRNAFNRPVMFPCGSLFRSFDHSRRFPFSGRARVGRV